MKSVAIKIKKRPKPEQGSLFSQIPREDYQRIQMEEWYEDTALDSLYLSKELIADIKAFADQSLAQFPVPEVGGFILGQYELLEGKWSSTADVFLPVREVMEQTNTRLVLGNGIATAYAAVMENYPTHSFIGWFHTHPGHSPFLSEIDLDFTHEVFFKSNFQVAIVLDSLTADYNTGIYSRQKNGKINNQENSKKIISWKKLIG